MTTEYAVWFIIGMAMLVHWLTLRTGKQYRDEIAELKRNLESMTDHMESHKSRHLTWKAHAESLRRELDAERFVHGRGDSYAGQTRRAAEWMKANRDAFERQKRASEAARRQSGPTWASVLGIPVTSTKEQIKARYKVLANKYHPDKPGGDAEQMKKLNHWYDLAMKEKA